MRCRRRRRSRGVRLGCWLFSLLACRFWLLALRPWRIWRGCLGAWVRLKYRPPTYVLPWPSHTWTGTGTVRPTQVSPEFSAAHLRGEQQRGGGRGNSARWPKGRSSITTYVHTKYGCPQYVHVCPKYGMYCMCTIQVGIPPSIHVSPPKPTRRARNVKSAPSPGRQGGWSQREA